MATGDARPRAVGRALVAALLATAAVGAAAQTPAPDPYRVRSAAALTLVNVDVVVTRKDGTPVEGLAADDFVVLHDGKPVAVTNLREERRGTSRSAPAASSEATAGSTKTGTPAPGRTPVPAPPDRMRRHLLFFFDDVALPDTGERNEVFGAMKAIVRSSLEPGDGAMIVSWRRGIRRVFPFTGDVALLERRLDAVARDASRLGTDTQTELDQLAADDAFYAWTSEGTGDSGPTRRRLIEERYAEVRARLGVLKGLMAVFSGLEGRKTLLLVSRRLSKSAGADYEARFQSTQGARRGLASEPVSGVDTRPFISALTKSANAAGVTIHAIHAEARSTGLPSAARGRRPSSPSASSRTSRTGTRSGTRSPKGAGRPSRSPSA